jgi:hypothetical protein
MASHRLIMGITDINQASEYALYPSPDFEGHNSAVAFSKSAEAAYFGFIKTTFFITDQCEKTHGSKAPGHDTSAAPRNEGRVTSYN